MTPLSSPSVVLDPKVDLPAGRNWLDIADGGELLAVGIPFLVVAEKFQGHSKVACHVA